MLHLRLLFFYAYLEDAAALSPQQPEITWADKAARPKQPLYTPWAETAVRQKQSRGRRRNALTSSTCAGDRKGCDVAHNRWANTDICRNPEAARGRPSLAGRAQVPRRRFSSLPRLAVPE